MNRIWISTTLAAALGCAVTLSGQAGTANQTAAPNGTQQPAGDAHRTVTVVGCVQRSGGSSEATGTTGASASSTTGSMGWILANASAEPAGAATSGTTGTSSSTSSSANREAGGTSSTTGRAEAVPAGPGGGANRGMSGTTYVLEQGTKPGSQDLSAHAGHKVEITGTLTGTPNPAATGATTTTTGANTSTETGRATSSTAQTSVTASETAKAGQRLQVASVKMLSPNCS